MNEIANVTRLAVEPLKLSPQVMDLLASSGLPIADLHAASLQLSGIMASGELIGVIGFEACGDVGLLRSLAVAPEMRGNGFGETLVTHLEKQAAASGIKALYLLTTTAAEFFAGRGYCEVAREAAPDAIRATGQFAGLCPASSTFMVKYLSA